jgi:hypothetical protein
MEQRAGTQVFRLRDKVKSKFLKFIKLEILNNFSASDSGDNSFENP